MKRKTVVKDNIEYGISNIGFLLKLDLDEGVVVLWAHHNEIQYTLFVGAGKGKGTKKSVILQLPEMSTEIQTDPMVHWG